MYSYSSDYYQQLTLESWFTNLEQKSLNRSQQLPARGTQREYGSKPLKHSIVKRILVFKR